MMLQAGYDSRKSTFDQITTQLAKDKLLDRFGIEGQGDSAEEVIKAL